MSASSAEGRRPASIEEPQINTDAHRCSIRGAVSVSIGVHLRLYLRHLDSDNVRDAPVREENDKKIRDRKIARMSIRVEVGSCDILAPYFLVKFFGVIEWNDLIVIGRKQY
jgi:hypothetical protein